MTRRLFSVMILATACTAMFASTAHAAGATTNPGKRGERLKEALAQLDLSASQKQQIKQIVEDAKQQRQSQAGSATGHAHARKAVLEKIMAVLTPAQKSKLKEILRSERSQKA